MPSTHSMVGLAVPATVVYVTTGKYEYSLLLGIVFSWYSPLFLSFFTLKLLVTFLLLLVYFIEELGDK